MARQVLEQTDEQTLSQIRDKFSREYLRELPLRYQIGLLGLLAIFLLPTALKPVQLSGVILLVYLMIFAMSWDFVSGYTGQISLGHTMFLATGGYSTAVLNLQHGVHPLLSIIIAVLVAGLLGIIIGVPALRVEGPYLALITLVVPLLMIRFIIYFSNSLPILAPEGLKGTGGFIQAPDAIVGTSSSAAITVPTFRLAILGDYYFAVLLFVFSLAVMWGITRSSTGKILTAIREDTKVVSAAGLNPAKYKIFSFVVSGMFGGLAGAALVHSSAGHPLPDLLLRIQVSMQVIVMVIIGGMGTIVGGAIGAIVFALINQVFALIPFELPLINKPFGALEPIPVFLMVLVLLYIRPDGILPASIDFGRRLKAFWRGEEPQERKNPGDSIVERVIETNLQTLREKLK